MPGTILTAALAENLDLKKGEMLMPAKPTQDVETPVRAIFAAYREKRRDLAEALIASEFSFTSPYDDAIGRQAYFARCWPNSELLTDFHIERLVVAGEGAFVTYLVTASDGVSFRNTEYLVVKNGQIASVEVYFGASYRDGKFLPKSQESRDE